MEYRNNIEEILDFLKSNGHDRGRIEARLGYSANAIDQALARGGNRRLLKVLELYKDWVLQNATSSFQVGGRALPSTPAELGEVLEELARIAKAMPSGMPEKRPLDKGSPNVEIDQKALDNQKKGKPKTVNRSGKGVTGKA